MNDIQIIYDAIVSRFGGESEEDKLMSNALVPNEMDKAPLAVQIKDKNGNPMLVFFTLDPTSENSADCILIGTEDLVSIWVGIETDVDTGDETLVFSIESCPEEYEYYINQAIEKIPSMYSVDLIHQLLLETQP